MDYLDDPELLRKIVAQMRKFDAVKLTDSEKRFFERKGVDGNHDPAFFFQIIATTLVIKQELVKPGEDILERRRQLQEHLVFCEQVMRFVYREAIGINTGTALAQLVKTVLDINIDSD